MQDSFNHPYAKQSKAKQSKQKSLTDSQRIFEKKNL